MLKLLLLAALFCVVQVKAVSLFQVSLEEFTLFKLKYGKKYADETEDKFRNKIFNENKYKIALHNQKYEQGLVNFSLAMNQFGDLLNHEFRSLMNGYKMSNRSRSGATYLTVSNVVLPKSVNWVEKGYVTPVKDQGHCGSCWAFSATGSLEGQHFRQTGKLVSLSEQNLVDCSFAFGNYGCMGGVMDRAFQYVIANKGIDTEKSYPYLAQDEDCFFNKDTVGATIAGFTDIQPDSEAALQEAVATLGPISIAIDAGHESFRFYHTGVYVEPECDSSALDHGVLAVGYGTEEQGGDYWLVKNSWSDNWGDKGYIKMARNKDNQCGVASSASYPLV